MAPATSTPTSGSNIPGILQPLHPEGLRAFPPEVRKYIFTAMFSKEPGRLIRQWPMPAILKALKSYDDVLYQEALASFYELGIVVVVKGSHISEPARFRGGPISDDEMPLIRNVQINFEDYMKDCLRSVWYRDTHPPSIFPSQQFLQHSDFFDQLSNVRSLTLNFPNMELPYRGNQVYRAPIREHLSDELSPQTVEFKEIVRTMTGKFPSLRKLSVTFDDRPKINRNPERWEAWRTVLPEPVTGEFESKSLSVIQQALGINPKMEHVTSVSDDPFITIPMPRLQIIQIITGTQLVWHTPSSNGLSGNTVRFCQHEWKAAGPQITTWFWEAKKGEKLVWDENKIEPGWKEFIPYDGNLGDGIRWTEELVTRTSEGLIFF